MTTTNTWRFRAFLYLTAATLAVAFLGFQLSAIRTTVLGGRTEIQALRRAIEAEREERTTLEVRATELAERAERLEQAMVSAKAELARAEELEASLDRMEKRQAVLEGAFAGVQAELHVALGRIEESSADLADYGRKLHELAPDDYSSLLAPTVKINSKSDVGSGTIIYSKQHGEEFLSYILTAHHIVEQNAGAADGGAGPPIPLELITFVDGKKVREERGVVVSVNPILDLALVEARSREPFDSVARLVPRTKLDSVRLFSRVHALGCPLGYAPIPTSGELTSKSKMLDGQSYWMINAPTIFGNSGGGIYLADSGELIGVLSRISAYKNLIDVAVPHMGIVTSMTHVYAWLEAEHFQFVYDSEYTYESCGAARIAARRGITLPTAAINAVVPASTAAQ